MPNNPGLNWIDALASRRWQRAASCPPRPAAAAASSTLPPCSPASPHRCASGRRRCLGRSWQVGEVAMPGQLQRRTPAVAVSDGAQAESSQATCSFACLPTPSPLIPALQWSSLEVTPRRLPSPMTARLAWAATCSAAAPAAPAPLPPSSRWVGGSVLVSGHCKHLQWPPARRVAGEAAAKSHRRWCRHCCCCCCPCCPVACRRA